MSTFGMLLKEYRERAGLSQNELANQAGLSASTISRIESGERNAPRSRKQVVAMARALGLSQEEADILLSAGDFAPGTAPELAVHPRDETLYRIAQELEALRIDPQIGPAQVRFVEEAMLLILRGARAALPEADLAVLPSGAPTARSLADEERYLDDLLGDFVSGAAGTPVAGPPVSGAMPWAVLGAVARSRRWELKRRLAEALPALLGVDPARTVPLMSILRDDPPDPEWRTDIRRRAIEAAPALWGVRPEAVAPLLRWREGDEVYAALATLDVLADIGDEDTTGEVRADALPHVEGGQQEAVTLYARLLDESASDPDAALRSIEGHRADEERLVRICLARALGRLLPARPAETLHWMRHFLRQAEGKPVEHQNVRRAITHALPGLIALLGGPYDEAALRLLRAMAADEDVHIRRVLCDVLPQISDRSREVALDLIEAYLLQDRDQYVRERTWNALRRLMGQGVERAEDLCARLIELA
jgi:transcriptional regulator with XRE-family HTH domain